MTGRYVAMAFLAAAFRVQRVRQTEPIGDVLIDGFDGKDYSPAGGLYCRQKL